MYIKGHRIGKHFVFRSNISRRAGLNTVLNTPTSLLYSVSLGVRPRLCELIHYSISRHAHLYRRPSVTDPPQPLPLSYCELFIINQNSLRRRSAHARCQNHVMFTHVTARYLHTSRGVISGSL